MVKDHYPRISVVMPVYNAESYLAEAIESILNQTFTNFEFIIVDDGPTDKSYKIIEEYSKKDSRIVCLKNEKKFGVAETRTRGIRNAKGKYIAVADADDISLPMRLEKQYNYLEKNKGCGVVGSFIELFDSVTGKIIGIREYYEDDARLRRRIFLYCPIANPSSMIRKEVFSNIGFYDPKYKTAVDLDFWFRLGMEYKFANIQEVLIKYRVHKKSQTISKTKDMERNSLEIRKKYSHGYGYSFTLLDRIYNIIHKLSLYVIPPRMTIWLFNLIRNK